MTGERVQGNRDHLSFLLPWICKQEKKKRKIGIGEGEAEEKRKSFRRWKPRVDKRRESIKVSLFSSTNCDNFSIAPITVILSLSLSLLPSVQNCACNYRAAAGTFKQDFEPWGNIENNLDNRLPICYLADL